MLDCRVVKHRPDFTVDVTIRAETGSRVAIWGTSAAGKSTVLSCLAGLERQDDGYVRFDNEQWFPPPRPLHQRWLGYLTQKERLFPHLDVEDNVLFALTARQRIEQRSWISEIRERLKLDAFWLKSATALSGGQSRRAALARTMCRRPPLILLDEPFVGLDRQLVSELITILLDWQRQHRFTLLLVDHDPSIVRRLCESVIIMDRGRAADWRAASGFHPDADDF